MIAPDEEHLLGNGIVGQADAEVLRRALTEVYTHAGVLFNNLGSVLDSGKATAVMATHPGKSKVAAGLACGLTWTIAKGMAEGDISTLEE